MPGRKFGERIKYSVLLMHVIRGLHADVVTDERLDAFLRQGYRLLRKDGLVFVVFVRGIQGVYLNFLRNITILSHTH
jgi:hypothetical protein